MITFYTYNEETKQLTPVKRVLKQDGKILVLGNPDDFAKYCVAGRPSGKSEKKTHPARTNAIPTP